MATSMQRNSHQIKRRESQALTLRDTEGSTCIGWFTGWSISPMRFGSQKQDLPAGTKTCGRNITIKQTAISGFVRPLYYLFFPVDLWKQREHILSHTHVTQTQHKKNTELPSANKPKNKKPSSLLRVNMHRHSWVFYYILPITSLDRWPHWVKLVVCWQ